MYIIAKTQHTRVVYKQQSRTDNGTNIGVVFPQRKPLPNFIFVPDRLAETYIHTN